MFKESSASANEIERDPFLVMEWCSFMVDYFRDDSGVNEGENPSCSDILVLEQRSGNINRWFITLCLQQRCKIDGFYRQSTKLFIQTLAEFGFLHFKYM